MHLLIFKNLHEGNYNACQLHLICIGPLRDIASYRMLSDPYATFITDIITAEQQYNVF